MSGRTVLLVVAAIASGAAPAWAQRVKTDHDPSASFDTVKTYYWATTDPSENELMNQRLVSAVDSWLTAKGWTRAPEAQADVAVVPIVTTRERTTLNTFYDGFGGGWAYQGWGGSTDSVSTYTEGTLVLDLYSARTKKLMWRGTATKTISDDPGRAADKIQQAVEKMFKKNFRSGVTQTA